MTLTGIVDRAKIVGMRIVIGLIVACAVGAFVGVIAFFWWLDHVRFLY